MSKHFLALPLLLILLGGSDAAMATQKRSARIPPPKGNDHLLEKWKEFSSEEGNFRILFPGTPKENSTDDTYSPDRLPVYYVIYKSAASYMAMYIDYPENIESPTIAKSILDRARDFGMSGADQAQEKPEIIKEIDISIEGHPGRFLQVNLSGNKVAWYKFVVVKNRFYFLEVVTPGGRFKATAAENDYEKIAMRFLDSFHLIKDGDTRAVLLKE